MKPTQMILRTVALSLLFTGALAYGGTVTGTVTNKTNNKPAAGDNVALVDVQNGMADVARATTDGSGHYSLTTPTNGPYLVRADHQGGTYFIAAPQGKVPGDITVYDTVATLAGVSLEASVLELETVNGQLNVDERFYIRNMSSPPRTQFSKNTFEFLLPEGAVLDGATVVRPGGLPTTNQPEPLGQKGHYTINVPIQPNQGEKETVFDVRFHVAYKGKYSFSPKLLKVADNLIVLLPKSITFKGDSGSPYQAVADDTHLQTIVAKNVKTGQSIGFTISGEGQMPREAQNPHGQGGAGAQGMGGMGGGQGTGADSNMGSADPNGDPNMGKPGGGIGNPIDTPDPLDKYKWWILGGLALVLVAAAAFMLRKPAANAGTIEGPAIPSTPAGKNALLLSVLKEELFALESDKLNGAITAAEYAETKPALEIVLKRALKQKA